MPDDEVTLRTWREGDDVELVPLWGPLGWTDAAMYARKFEDPANDPSRVFIAEVAGRIVAHAIATQRRLFVEGEWKLFGGVGHLVVHPVARGLGLGRRLLDLCDRAAEDAGARGVVMWTSKTFVPAYDMYIRTGYQLVAHEVIHQVDLKWLRSELGGTSLEVRRLAPEDSDRAAAIRMEWAHEAFPVSVGWDATAWLGEGHGLYDGASLAGTVTSALRDPVVPRAMMREALAAMAEWRLSAGESTAVFHLTVDSAADEMLTPLTHGREVRGMCTLVRPIGAPLDLGGQYPVHGAVWPW